MSAFDCFPRIVKEIEGLPEREQHALRALMPEGGFETIVFFPPFDASLSRRPVRGQHATKLDKPCAQIWAHKGRQLPVLRDVRDTISVEIITLDSILIFELGEILLHSWVELGHEDGKEICTTRVDFNSVGLQWIEPLIKALRGQTSKPIPAAMVKFTPEVQSQNTQLPYKWETILRDQVKASGEPIITFAYEPSVAPRWFWWGDVNDTS